MQNITLDRGKSLNYVMFTTNVGSLIKILHTNLLSRNNDAYFQKIIINCSNISTNQNYLRTISTNSATLKH